MSNVSKGLLAKARDAAKRAAEIREEELILARKEALETHGQDSPEYETADAAYTDFWEERSEDNKRKDELKSARRAVKEAKAKARIATGTSRRIEWADGGRDLVRGMTKPKSQFHAAAQGMLSTCVRDIGRWETACSYDNTRGVNRGDLVMPVTEPYEHPYEDGKMVVDVLIGDQLVKGIPAAALRPLGD